MQSKIKQCHWSWITVNDFQNATVAWPEFCGWNNRWLLVTHDIHSLMLWEHNQPATDLPQNIWIMSATFKCLFCSLGNNLLGTQSWHWTQVQQHAAPSLNLQTQLVSREAEVSEKTCKEKSQHPLIHVLIPRPPKKFWCLFKHRNETPEWWNTGMVKHRNETPENVSIIQCRDHSVPWSFSAAIIHCRVDSLPC